VMATHEVIITEVEVLLKTCAELLCEIDRHFPTESQET